MATEFKTGDAVWAKMRGFPAWPGKISPPKDDVKKPMAKKSSQWVFFFGENNFAWIPEESLFPFDKHKDRFTLTQRIPRGFKEALDQCEEYIRTGKDPSLELEKKKKPGRPAKTNGDPANESSSSTDAKRNQKRTGSPSSSSSTSSKKQKLVVKFPQRQKTSPKSGTGGKQNGDSESVSDNDELDTTKEGGKSDSEAEKRVSAGNNESTSSTEIPYSTLLSKSEVDRNLFSSMTSPGKSASTDAKKKGAVIATPMKIGFLGLGIMGQGLVMRLLESGHEVTVWNRTTMKCRDFLKAGAMRAATAQDVVKACDITFCCVSDPQAVKELTFGTHSVLQAIGHGKAFVDMSTVDVDTTTDLYEAITARGGRFLEAPICGNRQQSHDGQLVLLAAGDKSLYDDCHSCFKAMAKKSLYLGDVGNAARLKLVVNMIMGISIAGLAEGLALAEKVGIKQEDVLDVVNMGEMACDLYRTKGQAMVIDNYDPSHPLQHQQKDLRLAIGMADGVDQSLGVTAAANELYKKAKAIGYGENDASAVYRASIF